MPKNVPSLKAKQLIRLLESGGCKFSPPYVLRIFRQFGFTDGEIEELLR
jgi:hypothetical protein